MAEFDEPIKIIESFKNVTRKISYHDDEVREIDMEAFTEVDNKYIDLDIEKMKEWIKIKREFNAKKEKD